MRSAENSEPRSTAATVKSSSFRGSAQARGLGGWVWDSYSGEEVVELRSERRKLLAFPHQVSGLRKAGNKVLEELRRGWWPLELRVLQEWLRAQSAGAS